MLTCGIVPVFSGSCMTKEQRSPRGRRPLARRRLGLRLRLMLLLLFRRLPASYGDAAALADRRRQPNQYSCANTSAPPTAGPATHAKLAATAAAASASGEAGVQRSAPPATATQLAPGSTPHTAERPTPHARLASSHASLPRARTS